MLENSEESYINKCLRLIEKKLNWGESHDWTNYDFEKLSNEIEARTKIVLSVTTLKRIWGKVRYPHSPALTTLNTLAQYLAYEDWRAFKNNENSNPVGEINAGRQFRCGFNPASVRHKKYRLQFALISTLIISILAIFFAFKNHFFASKINEADYQFSVNKIISVGVPNSVVFTYDALKAKTDSVFIVQTWDIRRKTLVPKDLHKHSAIYYYPGFFRTKLIIDSTVVKTHDLQIATDGWLCLAENEPMPLYFKKEDYLKNNTIEIDEKTIEKYKLSLFPTAPRIRFFNQKDMGDLMNDNFTFETSLKNDFKEGNNACQNVAVLIQCKDAIIIIPLMAKACVGNAQLYVAGIRFDSKHADLSKFGCDLSQWVDLKVVTKNKLMKIYVNGIEAYSLTFPNSPTGIVGVQYRFNGVGAVKNTRFLNNKKVIDL